MTEPSARSGVRRPCCRNWLEWHFMTRHYPHKLFGWSTVDVCKLSVDASHPATAKFWIKWRISCEDGGVPKAGGHAKIRYYRVEEGPFATYATYHPEPNGDQDAEPDQVLNQETGMASNVDNSGQTH